MTTMTRLMTAEEVSDRRTARAMITLLAVAYLVPFLLVVPFLTAGANRLLVALQSGGSHLDLVIGPIAAVFTFAATYQWLLLAAVIAAAVVAGRVLWHEDRLDRQRRPHVYQ